MFEHILVFSFSLICSRLFVNYDRLALKENNTCLYFTHYIIQV